MHRFDIGFLFFHDQVQFAYCILVGGTEVCFSQVIYRTFAQQVYAVAKEQK